jgi:hypothetical protein
VSARPSRPGVSYSNLQFVPQWRTEELLRERLADLGGRVGLGREVTAVVNLLGWLALYNLAAGTWQSSPSR